MHRPVWACALQANGINSPRDPGFKLPHLSATRSSMCGCILVDPPPSSKFPLKEVTPLARVKERHQLIFWCHSLRPWSPLLRRVLAASSGASGSWSCSDGACSYAERVSCFLLRRCNGGWCHPRVSNGPLPGNSLFFTRAGIFLKCFFFNFQIAVCLLSSNNESTYGLTALG